MTLCSSSTAQTCMKMKRTPDRAAAGFTLLELLVVLVILATVTALAVRSVDGVVDQQNYEASRRGLEHIEVAVLGSPDERAADGSRIISGFVADMGRLPETMNVGGVLTLGELWDRDGLPIYDIVSNAIDTEVKIPAGWRGPYINLPLGSRNQLLDGWGNRYSSPLGATSDPPESTGYARLRDASDEVIDTVDQPIYIVRHLGANGEDLASDQGLNESADVRFDGRFSASVKAVVQLVDDQNRDGVRETHDKVFVRVFGPDPDNLSTAKVLQEFSAVGSTSETTLTFEITGSTIGMRAVRAYLCRADDTFIAHSPIKYVAFQSGVNFVPLTLLRPVVPSAPAPTP